MSQYKIDSENFDKSFKKLLQLKKGKNIVNGRFDLEPIKLEAKLDFIIHLLLSSNLIESLTYKILFWEETNKVESLIKSYKKKYSTIISYNNGKLPGIIFINEDVLDVLFLKELLINHFNHEMAKNPSLSLRVQICINKEDYITLIDIYDDRGFDIYYLER
ncbi:hypothetical protein [Flavobacterium sp.]|uniref:hypothetical protein n=1 Tax=Flavobacterium sp. TaxID=239 RepID=UPI00286D6AF3|nr:hypothetical protein [Flavobacterium sp.]